MRGGKFAQESVPSNAKASSVGQSDNIIVSITEQNRARALQMKSFAFRHSLAGSGAFSLSDVRRATKQLLDERRYNQIFCRTRGKELAPQDVFEALDALESPDETDTWVRLTRVDEVVPEFRNVVNQFYMDLSELYQRDIRAEVFRPFITLFVSSAKEITPYHIDHTWNFLCQLWGTKIVHLYDPDDPRVMKQTDREDWYMARSKLKKNEDMPSMAYHLASGDGVHHPVNAPHWVENGADISISLSLGLCLHRSNREAKIHQINFLLRKIGLQPSPIGHSMFRDEVKAAILKAVEKRNPQTFDDVVFSGVRRLSLPARMVLRMKNGLLRE